jgi:hypothetical protein
VGLNYVASHFMVAFRSFNNLIVKSRVTYLKKIHVASFITKGIVLKGMMEQVRAYKQNSNFI